MNYKDRYEEAYEKISAWLLAGLLSYNEDVVVGLENAPAAFGKLFGAHGGNFGKLVVCVYFSTMDVV